MSIVEKLSAYSRVRKIEWRRWSRAHVLAYRVLPSVNLRGANEAAFVKVVQVSEERALVRKFSFSLKKLKCLERISIFNQISIAQYLPLSKQLHLPLYHNNSKINFIDRLTVLSCGLNDAENFRLRRLQNMQTCAYRKCSLE